MFIVTLILSVLIFVYILLQQRKYFLDTKSNREAFERFFEKTHKYTSIISSDGGDEYPQLYPVGKEGSDLNNLIQEINTYLYKTKGTSDYEFIRSKVERKLNMRYDQSTVHLSFPTYLGLMGTFAGVFLGIFFFIVGFDSSGTVSDDSIRNLLIGVLVSMSTSLIGLILTTYNTARAGEARKKVEDDKNEFFDFIQTDVTKTASASLVSAISKLHDTVDTFQPAFSVVIDGFKAAFADCTKAFGEDFKQNVDAVTTAVAVMGNNMDRINANIDSQEKLLSTIKSDDFIKGLKDYVAAANNFVGITQSLNKFEEARRMMLAATQEAITIQNQYSDSLKIPREIAVRINQILDRIKDFEDNVNATVRALQTREVLGNDVIDAIRDQIKGISKKGKIAERYLELSDGKLEDLYKEQTAAIGEMNKRYKIALAKHLDDFEKVIDNQKAELESRHNDFLETLKIKFDAEDIRAEFSNLKKLDDVVDQIKALPKDFIQPSKIDDLGKRLEKIETELKKIEEAQKKNNNSGGGLFGIGRRNNDGQ